jgi:hypothetical protein
MHRLLSLLLPLPVAAQSTVAVIDAGAARMRIADSISATALSLSPAVRITGPLASLAASGTMSRLGVATTHSGALDASLSTRRRGALSGEIEAVAGGSAHDDGTRTGQWIALARLNASRAGRGVWIGGGMGATWAGAWRPLVQGDAGAWLARSDLTAALTVSPTIVDDSIVYADLLVSAHRERGLWELDGSLGGRAGQQLPNVPADRRLWGSASATRWLTPTIGLVASAGMYPVDFAQGYPGGEYASLSLRWRPVLSRSLMSVEPADAGDPVRAFQARRVAGDRYELRVLAPSAGSVEVSGDFSAWAPLRLVADARGWWVTTTSLSSGTHEVAVRIDGGAWRVPPGLPPLTDEFGGRSGLLAVPE